MMKKLLIYFHDKGGHKDNQNDFLAKLADKLDADIFKFNAPHPYKNGFAWYGKDAEGRIELDDFNHSVGYAFEKIEEEVKKRKMTFKDVIFAGNSQGGFMALNAGFLLGANKVIMLCSTFPLDFDYGEDIHEDFDIYWIEGGKDTFIPIEGKETYKRLLRDYKNKVHYIVNAKSTHNGLDMSIIDEIQ